MTNKLFKGLTYFLTLLLISVVFIAVVQIIDDMGPDTYILKFFDEKQKIVEVFEYRVGTPMSQEDMDKVNGCVAYKDTERLVWSSNPDRVVEEDISKLQKDTSLYLFIIPKVYSVNIKSDIDLDYDLICDGDIIAGSRVYLELNNQDDYVYIVKINNEIITPNNNGQYEIKIDKSDVDVAVIATQRLTITPVLEETYVYDGEKQEFYYLLVDGSGNSINNVEIKYFDSNKQSITEIVDAGKYYVTYHYLGTDYAIEDVTEEIIVEKAIPEIKVTEITKEYTGSVISYAESDVTSSSNGTVTFENNENVNVGTYTVKVNVAETANYLAHSINVPLTITKADLTVTGRDLSVFVGEGVDETKFSALFNGFKGSDNESVLTGTLVYTTNANENSPVGEYPLELSGLSSSNYNIIYEAGTIKVVSDAYIIEVDRNSLTHEYDGTSHKLEAILKSSSGIVEGVEFTYTLNGQPFNGAINKGQYKVTISYNSPLYGEGSIEENLVITAKALDASMFDKLPNYNYTGSPIEPTVHGSFNGKDLILDEDYAVSYKNNTANGIGSVVITALENSNFSGSVTLEFNIGLSDLDEAIIGLNEILDTYDGSLVDNLKLETANGSKIHYISTSTALSVDKETGNVKVIKQSVEQTVEVFVSSTYNDSIVYGTISFVIPAGENLLFADGTTVVIVGRRDNESGPFGNYMLMTDVINKGSSGQSRLQEFDTTLTDLSAVTFTDRNQIWTIKVVDGKYYLMSSLGTYLTWNSADGNNAGLSATGNALNITENNDGTYKISLVETPERYLVINSYTSSPFFAFYANENASLMYIKVVDTNLTDQEKVEIDKENVVIETDVTSELELPFSYGWSLITWTSNNEIIKINNQTNEILVTPGSEDTEVTLTATFDCNGTTVTKEYTVIVAKQTQTGGALFDATHDYAIVAKRNGYYYLLSQSVSNSRSVAVKTEFTDISSISTVADNCVWNIIPVSGGYIFKTTVNGTPKYIGTNAEAKTISLKTSEADAVVLDITFDGTYYKIIPVVSGTNRIFALNGNTSDYFNFYASGQIESIEIIDLTGSVSEMSDPEKLAIDKNGLSIETEVVDKLTLPVSGSYTTITWASSNTEVISIVGGVVTIAPVTVNTEVELTATLTINSLSDQKSFTVTVKPSTASSYKQITSLEGLTSGKEIIILNNDGTQAMGPQNGSIMSNLAFDINNVSNDILRITLLKNLSGNYILSTENGNLYYSGSENSLNCGNESGENAQWTITMSNDLFVITNVEYPDRIMQYNSGSPRFACYTSNQKKLQIYECTTVSKTPEDIVKLDIEKFSLPSSVESGYELPVTGTYGSKITWVIDISYVDALQDGCFLINNNSYNIYTKLYAHFEYDGYKSSQQEYSITIIGKTTVDPTPDLEYYDSLTATSGNALKAELRSLITTTHSKITTYDDCKNPEIVEKTDGDPNNPGNIILFWSGLSISSTWNDGKTWNREHVWPQSQGWFTTSNAGADLHHIRPTDSSVNSSHGNNPYGVVSGGSYVKTSSTNGSVTTLCKVGNSTFEPVDSKKGDVARIIFYLLIRYSESDAYAITNVATSMSMLLEWHESDPVDQSEITRNNAVCDIQGNRNPFIDYPDYADLIW